MINSLSWGIFIRLALAQYCIPSSIAQCDLLCWKHCAHLYSLWRYIIFDVEGRLVLLLCFGFLVLGKNLVPMNIIIWNGVHNISCAITCITWNFVTLYLEGQQRLRSVWKTLRTTVSLSFSLFWPWMYTNGKVLNKKQSYLLCKTSLLFQWSIRVNRNCKQL